MIVVDPFVSLAPVLLSNLVAPDLIKSYNSNDISIGRLFVKNNELILELLKLPCGITLVRLHSPQRHVSRSTFLIIM